MKMAKALSILLGMIVILSLVAPSVSAQGRENPDRPTGWSEDSHGNSADPNYEVVFPQDEVNSITITINPENWQAMLDNMTDLYGEFGTRDEGGDMGGNFPPAGMRPPAGERPPGMGIGGPVAIGTSENPIWVMADIEFDDQIWTNVGIRFKGNSSLMSSWGGGVWKLPFKLEFDQFEDNYPEIENQRFYGFKQLSFSSNWSDSSLLREKVTADIFREAGVPAAQTAFYAVSVDYGEGPIYFGLYTAVEVIDDTVIQTQFEDDSGNVYKPEGNGATFAEGSFAEESFSKETNQDEADYSDILALFAALHADTRLTDAVTWRSDLESVLNVDGFVRWLAVNTVVQNWDTYGQMAHNYYLYTEPATGLITWIPWDNNMALMDGMDMGIEGRGGPGPSGGLSFDLENVTADWPLIRYLMDDPVYHDLYASYIEETINGAFEPTKMTATYQALHDLIAPYVIGENGEQPGYTFLNSSEEFDTALTELINHASERHTAAQEYVSSQASDQ